MADILIPRRVLAQLIAHCRECHPHEACGILSGTGNIVENIHAMTNTEPSPVSYYMDPRELFSAMKTMRNEGQGMVAMYHSHPQSPAYPSPKDVSLASYPDAVYIIAGMSNTDAPEVRAYTIIDGAIHAVSIRTDD